MSFLREKQFFPVQRKYRYYIRRIAANDYVSLIYSKILDWNVGAKVSIFYLTAKHLEIYSLKRKMYYRLRIMSAFFALLASFKAYKTLSSFGKLWFYSLYNLHETYTKICAGK